MTFTAILGVTGVGKTTLSNCLAEATRGIAFNEPPRADWPQFIESGFISRSFEVMHWFRCHQIDAILKAKKHGNDRQTFTDAYYHKILADYILDESSYWIIPRLDPYFQNFFQTCLLDKKELPFADQIIFLYADKDDWIKLIKERSGPCDSIVLKEGFTTQNLMRSATKIMCHENDIPLLEVKQRYGCFKNTLESCLSWFKL